MSPRFYTAHVRFLRHRKESDSIPDFCYPDMTGRTVFNIERAVAWWSTYMPWDYSVSSDIYDLPEEVSFDKKLLVGHVPTISGFVFEPVPYIYQKREFIDLDCGCGYRDMDGKLACMRLEDEKIWYI